MKSLIVTLQMPANSYPFQANLGKEDHAPDKERRHGIISLYADFAQGHVEGHEKKGNAQKISREKVERQMLTEIDKAGFPIEYKMSWYHAIFVSFNFDAFWKGVAKRWKLPKSCTQRFEPDENLYEYDAPTDLDETEEDAEDEVDHEAEDDVEDDVEDEVHSAIHNDATPTTNNSPPVVSQTPALGTNHESRSFSSDSGDSSRSSTPDNWPKLTEENKLAPHPQRRPPPMCRECGNIYRPCWCDQNNDDGNNDADCASERDSQRGGHEMTALVNPLDELQNYCDFPSATSTYVEYPSVASGYVNGLAGDEGEHSTYEEPSLSKSKGKAKAPTIPYEQSRNTSDAMHSRALKEEDDSDYQDTPSNRKAKTKSKPKTKATPTIKGSAKPKGITKKKAAPKQKSQTAAQLKTAAAKTREPAVPKAKKATPSASQAKKAAPKANPANTTPAPASNTSNSQAQLPPPSSQPTTTPTHLSNDNNLQTQATTTMPDSLSHHPAPAHPATAPAPTSGLKRMLELYPEDGDDSPSSKRAKVGDVAAAHDNGGRKKASLKKVVRMKPIEEAWDGVPRGFGEYEIV